MATAAIVGTALGGGLTGPLRGLFVGGLDVRLKPGSETQRYGVPIDSVKVIESGHGGVSAMVFRLEDPAAELAIAPGDAVFFANHTTDLPIFRGWLQGPITAMPFAGIGRAWQLRAVGPEALLDWNVIGTDTTVAAGTRVEAAVQHLAALVIGGMTHPLRAFSEGRNSSQAGPVAQLNTTPVTTDQAVTVTAGTTLREAIRAVLDVVTDGGYKATASGPYVTVDMWYGLRVWGLGGTLADYDDLNVSDTHAGPVRAADLEHTTDVTGVPRAVYVKGGNAAGSGLVSDGSGLPGPTATLNDSTILTSAMRDAVGLAYLADRAPTIRGKFRRDAFTDTSTVADHVSVESTVIIADANVGNTSGRIMQIEKTFLPAGKEEWLIAYGSLPPSLPRAIRQLTRDVRS